MHPTRTDRTKKLAEWRQRMARESLSVPPDRGALWTGIGADVAQNLARSMGLVTLEMTPVGESLDHGPLGRELVKDFGGDWIAEKRLIFGALSVNFVESLLGRVTIFLPADLARPRNGAPGSFAYAAKIIWDELREADFGDPRVSLHRISAMRVCRVRGGRIVDDTFMSASGQLH